MTTFQVFHRTKNRFETTDREHAEFVAVAVVRVHGDEIAEVGDAAMHVALDVVYEKTNHIDRHWWENDDVEVIGTKNHRSTSVGDEIEITATGERYAVASVGFVKVVDAAHAPDNTVYIARNTLSSDSYSVRWRDVQASNIDRRYAAGMLYMARHMGWPLKFTFDAAVAS